MSVYRVMKNIFLMFLLMVSFHPGAQSRDFKVVVPKSMDNSPFKVSKKIYHKNWIDFNKNGKKDIYEDPSRRIDERIDDLLSKMNIKEKTCQLATLYGFESCLKDQLPKKNWLDQVWVDGIGNIDEHLNKISKNDYSFPYSNHAKAINEVQRFFVEQTRLGIPVDFSNEGIRGLKHEKTTFFPPQIGVGATWDKHLVHEIGRVTGTEARALGYTNVYSPILDVCRDPRWGRSCESYSESPYLAGMLGKQQVKGIQDCGVVSTSKHFAVYGTPIGGRDGYCRTDPQVAPREVYNIHLEPFRMAIQEAGQLGTMNSFNDYDGIPIAGSKLFLTDILRKEWGFKGYVVTDSESLEFLHNFHHVCNNYKESIVKALTAGVTVRTYFDSPAVFLAPLREAIKSGDISTEIIDQRVREVLYVKYWLGLFDSPYVINPDQANEIVNCSAHKKIALQASRESMVLLKNDNGILPLSKKLRKVAVIGPNAKSEQSLITRYGPQAPEIISVYEGIKTALPDSVEVVYSKGCAITDKHFPESDLVDYPLNESEQKSIDKAVELVRSADVAILVVGEDRKIVGESRTRINLDLSGHQKELVQAIQATGVPTVMVLVNGRAIGINWADKHIPAILEAWMPGEFMGQAVAEVLFGDYNPGGKLSVTFPVSTGVIPWAFPFKPHSRGIGFARVKKSEIYPFGHGLSYTQFKYSQLHISSDSIKTSGEITVRCRVKNTGKRMGDEVVQLYVKDVVSSVTTYEKMLRGFERITLAPGQEKEVCFVLRNKDLSLFNENMDRVVEPGLFEVFVGSSSQDIRLKNSFVVSE